MQNQDDKLSKKKLEEDANTLFPPNDHFGIETTCGCDTYAYEQERVMCDLQGFEVLSHIEDGKPCYNYVRLKQNCFDEYEDINLNIVVLDQINQKKEKGKYQRAQSFKKEQQKQQLGELNYIHSKDIRPKKYGDNKPKYACDLIKKLFTENKNEITYNYFHLNSTEEIPDITEKKEVFSIFSNKISDRVNASIGVVFVKDVDGKNYAIMCNHSDNKNIEEVKRIFEKDIKNTEIINLPQIQYDGNHCTILNKEFLSEMKEFFKNKDIGEAINELKQIANKPKLAIQTFPKLYQYRQSRPIDLKNKIKKNGKKEVKINMDNNINYLPNTDVYDFEELLLKKDKKTGKPKKRNVGLLIRGWQIALDYTLENHKNISVIELEKFYNILTKQIDFFDNLIDLQIKNRDTKRYSELFDEKKIKSLSKIVENRKKNITRDENDLITSRNKVDQEYIKKRKQEIIDNINAGYHTSSPVFISKNIQKEINDYFNKEDFLEIGDVLEQYNKLSDNGKLNFNLEKARRLFFENLEKQKQNNCLLCERKKPFEGNELINEEAIEKLNKKNNDSRIEIKDIEDGDIQDPENLPETEYDNFINNVINGRDIEEKYKNKKIDDPELFRQKANVCKFRRFWNCLDCCKLGRLSREVDFDNAVKNIINNKDVLTTNNILNNYNRNQGGVIE